jgi:hypothetical protein
MTGEYRYWPDIYTNSRCPTKVPIRDFHGQTGENHKDQSGKQVSGPDSLKYLPDTSVGSCSCGYVTHETSIR